MTADGKHLDILKQGVETWNQWRKENPEIRLGLSSADLSEADLILWKLDIGHMPYLPT